METLKINGMSCGHCTGSVKKALEAIPGLSQISVDLEEKEASFNNDGVAREDIRAAISGIGFEPEEEEYFSLRTPLQKIVLRLADQPGHGQPHKGED